jgi:hypothetical protein
MLNPDAALKSTSSENGRSVAEKLLRMRALRVGFAGRGLAGRGLAGSAGVGIEVRLFDWTNRPYFAIRHRLMPGPPVQPVDQSKNPKTKD